jgi:hypothetical protein
LIDTTEIDELTDDLTHPIATVHSYDAVLTLGGGGVYLGIVIAAPLDASARSLARLREKQRFYLDSFFSEFGREKWGTPKDGKMKIYVSVHPASSQEAFKILDAFCDEARGRGIEILISKTAS